MIIFSLILWRINNRESMKRIVLFLACVLLMVGMVPADDRDVLVKKGEKVPSFVVEMFDGRKIDVKDLRGKIVLINFWATWCPPCQEEMKRVQKEIIDRFKDKDFVFLPISREETREQIARFRERHGYAFPMGLDPGREIFSKFAKSGIPRNFVIDRKGRIVYLEVGYTEESFAKLVETLERLLEKKEGVEECKRVA